MEQRERDLVAGFVRKNYVELIPIEIIEIIYMFYLILIDTKILSKSEQLSLYNLLYGVLHKRQPEVKNRKKKKKMNLQIDLLYTASENEFNAHKFHDTCNHKGPTITIIHNEYDYIFGGYIDKSWNKQEQTQNDPNSFLFSIRPNVKIYELADDHTDGENAVWSNYAFGPTFGQGNDICVRSEAKASGYSRSYNMKESEIFGVERDAVKSTFMLKEYEVFSVSV